MTAICKILDLNMLLYLCVDSDDGINFSEGIKGTLHVTSDQTDRDDDEKSVM